MAEDTLNTEQRHIYNLAVTQASSVYFTGLPVSGKSFLLSAIHRGLLETYTSGEVALTASTAFAVKSFGRPCATLFEFAGLRNTQQDAPTIVAMMSESERQRWQRTKVLLIDEIGMISARIFDTLEAVARLVRANNDNFGGLRLIVTGQIFGIGPVDDPNDKTFMAKCWNASFAHQIKMVETWLDQPLADIMRALLAQQPESSVADQLKILKERGSPYLSNYHVFAALRPDLAAADRAKSAPMAPGSTVDKIDLWMGIVPQQYGSFHKGMLVALVKTAGDLREGAVGTIVEIMQLVGSGTIVPLVRFTDSQGRGYDRLVTPEQFGLLDAEGLYVRSQFPLVPAEAYNALKRPDHSA